MHGIAMILPFEGGSIAVWYGVADMGVKVNTAALEASSNPVIAAQASGGAEEGDDKPKPGQDRAINLQTAAALIKRH